MFAYIPVTAYNITYLVSKLNIMPVEVNTQVVFLSETVYIRLHLLMITACSI